jgi:hypothetical protein
MIKGSNLNLYKHITYCNKTQNYSAMQKNIALLLVITTFTISLYAQSFQDYTEYSRATDPLAKYELLLANPCEDEIYLELKKINIDEMSERQFEIFKEKDKACNEYQKTQIELEPENKTAASMEKAANAGQAYLIIAGIGLIISIVYLINASNELDDLSY